MKKNFAKGSKVRAPRGVLKTTQLAGTSTTHTLPRSLPSGENNGDGFYFQYCPWIWIRPQVRSAVCTVQYVSLFTFFFFADTINYY